MISWKDIHQFLTEELAIALLYVLDSRGSSPGRQGFRMVVSQSGKMSGSIGGGIMEHKLVEFAKSHLEKGQQEIVIKKQIHSKSVAENQSGMICSGEQWIAIVPLTEQDSSTIEQIIINEQGGAITLSPIGLRFIQTKSQEPIHFSYTDEANWQYSENIGFKQFAFIIGGGHVSQSLTKVLRDLTFHCTVFDNRQDLNTLANNTYAHKKIVVDYEELGTLIPEGNDNYIFIMSFGYRTDLLILKQLIDHNVAYKGMMGSEEKTKHLLDEMRSLGYTNEQLSSIISPIGIPIKSRTPEEIAISIAAQIIQLQNKDLP